MISRTETIGPRRKILRKWLQRAWGEHFDPAQAQCGPRAGSGSSLQFCTEVLYPIIKWFWDLHKILFNPD